VAGPVRATSVNGGIDAEGLGGLAELSTVNGEVQADFEKISPANPISLRSVNGAIRLSIPQGAGASLTARNLSGGIESDFGRVSREPAGNALNAAVQGGGAPIRVDNTNGGISIHSQWSRRRERAAF
jgi:DUF4097 and DUF4098 domain-containing protein YvlB